MSGQYPGQQPFEYGHVAPQYPESSQATTVFILGIVSIVFLPLLAPFAWALGSREVAAIDAGRRSPENRQLARAGQIIGIVVSVILILFVALIAIVILASLIRV